MRKIRHDCPQLNAPALGVDSTGEAGLTGSGEVTPAMRDPFSVEWLNVNRGTISTAKPISGGEVRTFTTPLGGPAVLYLKATSE